MATERNLYHSPLGQNHFLFVFKNKADVQKIIVDSPWSAMGYYLALAPWSPFWVQAHGLPFGKLTKSYAGELASKISSQIEVDCIGDGIQLSSCFLRFRVSVDLSAPL
ncbi:hypothetical protein CTI12_AA078280 [Artemisia annua]|uniref:DUF4283 domain-containing protein n=1 Tax=Artemisia annua TaxID=35608 RepID=A0A2U1Q3I1_ARTAN|nr:hypothetical protein CTI12_AA078280 [Artemisia annua]